jgi:hypothetical protein
MDEAALARVTGGSVVMHDQLTHLLEAAQRPNITLQVVGFEYGMHPGIETNFILLTMGNVLPDVVYTEGVPEPTDSSLPGDLRQYRRIWDALRAIALSPRDSLQRIRQYVDRFSR